MNNTMMNSDFRNQQPQASERTSQTEMMISRQAQEVQAAMVIAKRFPRDQITAYNKVMQACQRPSLAEKAIYEYPRGGEKVTGPSIRLAEAIAQNWGNIDFGIMELEQKNGESQVMAYAWDLETNTRQTKIFAVPHVRNTRKGSYKLTDSRDIYELVANQGARRMRACILGVIPGDVVEDAVNECNRTLEGSNKKPLVDLIREMADIFQKEFGVTVKQIEKFIGWNTNSFTIKDIMKLKRVYNSLHDGMAKTTDYFEMAPKVDEKEISDPFGGKDSKTKEKESVKKK
ncbi:MAG: hypothetical protein LUF92_14620 [Clostridiales bacterium]|nr:hypothetical protein [Clostridiales bacterium]